MSVQIMHSASMISMNIMNNVGQLVSDSVVMNNIFNEYTWDEQCFLWTMLGWPMILGNSARSIIPPKFPSVSPDVWIVNIYSYFVHGLT